MNPPAIDLAWIATRRKTLLTPTERERLTVVRRMFDGSSYPASHGADPHAVAAIDALLAP